MTKTKKRAPLAEAVSFAHLLPLTAGASTRAEEDDDKDKGPDAEDGEDDDKKPAGRKAKKARADDQGNDDGEDDGAEDDAGDDDDKDPDAEDGDEEDNKKPAGKKTKKARADDGDDDGDGNGDEEDGASARAGAMRERRRCASIFGSRHAAGRPDLAAHLAFNTNMSASEAIGTMKTLVGGQAAGARGARSTLADRMRAESVPNPGQGASAAPTGPKGLAAAMIAASKKAQGTGA